MRLASLLRGLVLALALILAPVVPLSWATAQEAAAPDEATSADTPVEDVAPAFREIAGVNLDDWEAFAARVEAALETGRVSDSVLGDLRRDLVVWRDKFATAKDLSSVRIQALEAQIADLGTAPAEGETEPAAIAIQRDRLEAELDTLLAPVTSARLEYTRADALVAALDQNLRTRQRRDVTLQGPTPFDWNSWPTAVESLARTFRLAWSAALASWMNQSQRATLLADLPLSIALGLVGLVFLLFGWRSVRRVGESLRAGKSMAVRGAWGFVI